MILKIIGALCATGAVCFDFASYIKQIKKTLRTRHSGQVSSSAYLYKMAKISCNLIGLAIFANWVGFSVEAASLTICITALYIVAKFKPRKWRLFS